MTEVNPEFSIPLLLYFITKRVNEGRWTKLLNYYFFQSLKVNYYLIYGVGSTRVGGLITRFGMYMNKYYEHLVDDEIMIPQLLKMNFYPPKQIELIGVRVFNNREYRISWAGSKQLNNYSKGGVCKLSNLHTLFAKKKVDQTDWRVPIPKADFPMYLEVNHMIEDGLGFWVPKVKSELSDVGFAFFERGTNNIL